MSDDRIIGIGGIGVFGANEAPVIPSGAAVKRYEQAVKRAQVCKRCGASEMDGAMFTTLGGQNICDDCV